MGLELQNAMKFLKNDRANGGIIDSLVAVILIASTVLIVVQSVASAQADSNVTGTLDTLLGLLPIFFVLGGVIYMVYRFRGDDHGRSGF